VTLLQVGHGSKPRRARRSVPSEPSYAVISAGKPGEGTNSTYCHPRKETVDALTAALGGPGSRAGKLHKNAGAIERREPVWLLIEWCDGEPQPSNYFTRFGVHAGKQDSVLCKIRRLATNVTTTCPSVPVPRSRIMA
jgi:hypothetical protein